MHLHRLLCRDHLCYIINFKSLVVALSHQSLSFLGCRSNTFNCLFCSDCFCCWCFPFLFLFLLLADPIRSFFNSFVLYKFISHPPALLESASSFFHHSLWRNSPWLLYSFLDWISQSQCHPIELELLRFSFSFSFHIHCCKPLKSAIVCLI